MGKEGLQPPQEQGVPKEKKYPTIHGFYGRDVSIRLVQNPKTGQDELFFKFMLGQRRGEGVSWLPVAIQGKKAEKFLDIVPDLTVQDTLAIRGTYQEWVRKGKPVTEFWAYHIQPPERLRPPKPEKQ